MNNRLSFAQILQKKKSNDSVHNSRISSRQVFPQTQFNNETQHPSLSELMDSFIQYPNEPEESFVLDFSQGQVQHFSERSSQDFQMGLNPLDSFIMTQSYLNAQKMKNKNEVNFNNKRIKTSNHVGLAEMSRQYVNVKQNKNVNLGNADNLFDFSTRIHREAEESSQRQFMECSRNAKPINMKQMISNTKIIQSQTCHAPILESKRQNLTNIHNVPKIQRSERAEEGTKKLSRYQVNYQESQRKDEPEPPKEKKKLILSKSNSQKAQPEQKPQPENKLKISKKPSYEQQFLLAGITETSSPTPMQTSQDRRIEDAKNQINQYLQIRQKSPVEPRSFIKQPAPKQVPELKPKKSEGVQYSFASEVQALGNKAPVDSFAGTKKEMKEIQEEILVKENEKMLACIEYTQSEVDLEDQEKIEEDLPAFRKNLQVSQSIPERKDTQSEPREQYTLQKYIPASRPVQIEPVTIDPEAIKDTSRDQPSQYSEMIEKIIVQPSIEEDSSEKDEVNNSDHPNLQSKQFAEGKEIKREPYHDVSSIDIRISGEGSQFCMKNLSGQKIDIPIVFPHTDQRIQIPKLNVSDFESVSNNSMLSPIKKCPQTESPLHENISNVESNPPISQNESMNIHRHQSSHGFIYKMRVHSRNNSFTSNYNSSIHGDQSENYDVGISGNSHSSLYIKDSPIVEKEGQGESKEEYNMSKFKPDRRKYDEVEVSVSVEIPENQGESPKVEQQIREVVQIQMQQKQEQKPLVQNAPQETVQKQEAPQKKEALQQQRAPISNIQDIKTVQQQQKQQEGKVLDENQSQINKIEPQSNAPLINQNFKQEFQIHIAEENIAQVEQKQQETPELQVNTPSENVRSPELLPQIVVTGEEPPVCEQNLEPSPKSSENPIQIPKKQQIITPTPAIASSMKQSIKEQPPKKEEEAFKFDLDW